MTDNPIRQPKHARPQAGQTQLEPARPLRRPPVPVWLNVGFVTLALVLLLVPLVGMPFASGEASAEKRELAAWPTLMVDGLPNWDYLSEAGTYFEDRFAFRTQLVDLDASIKQHLFKTSSTTNVVVGNDGWLYYAGTLDDYQRVNQMSDLGVTNAAINIQLMQEYVESLGKTFTFTICPNKNTLYPAHMPYYLLAGDGPSNLERLEPLLADYGIHYVSMTDALMASSKELYYERDSHWNNEGALVGYNALMEAIGREHETYETTEVTQGDAHTGDVDGMLHPGTAQVEMGPLWPSSERFSYANDSTSVEDAFIVTRSEVEGAHGILMMYRDSFGNALLPYFACEYASGVFTKRIPYDMSEQALKGVQDVMVERTERHLPFFASTPPYMPAPQRDGVEVASEHATATTLTATENGPYLVIEGDIDQLFARPGSRYYLRITLSDGTSRTYEAFHVSPEVSEGQDSEGSEDETASSIKSEYGYRAFVTDAFDATDVTVIVQTDGEATSVFTGSINLGG